MMPPPTTIRSRGRTARSVVSAGSTAHLLRTSDEGLTAAPTAGSIVAAGAGGGKVAGGRRSPIH